MPLGHAVMWCHCAVARVFRNIVASNYAFPAKSRIENGCVSRQAKFFKRLSRCTRQGIKEKRLTLFIDYIVKKGSEFRAAELGSRIGDQLHQVFEIQLGSDRGAGVV